MRGLDPRIHRKKRFIQGMDCRVKPGNDGGWAGVNGRSYDRTQRLKFSTSGKL